MPNSNQIQKIIFPEESSSIISEFLEKYGLGESPRKVFEKICQGEKIFGNVLAKIVKRAAEEKFSDQKLVSSLKTELPLSLKEAENLAEDIKRKLLALVEKTPPKMSSPIISEEKEEAKRRDTYRESIE